MTRYRSPRDGPSRIVRTAPSRSQTCAARDLAWVRATLTNSEVPRTLMQTRTPRERALAQVNSSYQTPSNPVRAGPQKLLAQAATSIRHATFGGGWAEVNASIALIARLRGGPHPRRRTLKTPNRALRALAGVSEQLASGELEASSSR